MSAPTSDPVGDPTVHELLLALAGRLDDDLLAWARELVAVGEEGQAVELATAALAAERGRVYARAAGSGRRRPPGRRTPT